MVFFYTDSGSNPRESVPESAPEPNEQMLLDRLIDAYARNATEHYLTKIIRLMKSDYVSNKKRKASRKLDAYVANKKGSASSTDQSTTCFVCMEAGKTGKAPETRRRKRESMISLGCDSQHTFHVECIRRWAREKCLLSGKFTCPLCRSETIFSTESKVERDVREFLDALS
jgi:hypothetical protein